MLDTDPKLAAFLPTLRGAPWIALDTEADSLHAYPEKLCLLQISVPERDVLLDPLSSMDLAPVWPILHDHELIMHGADYDLRLLRKSARFVPTAIFDTMMASRLVGRREFGLTSLVLHTLGVHLEKGPQKANWARRPLTARMEAYARNDTHYLHPLAEILRAELRAKGRLAWLEEACRRLIAECAQPRKVDPDEVWRIKGSARLHPRALAVLRELWHWREGEAIACNRPPFFVLSPETMVNVAAAAADSRASERLLPHSVSPRRRHEIHEAILRGLAAPKLPSVHRQSGRRLTDAGKKRLRELEKRRDRRAAELGIDPTLIASRADLVSLAADWSSHERALMKWQRELLGD